MAELRAALSIRGQSLMLSGVSKGKEQPVRTVAIGLRFPEGPVAMADGSVLLVEIERQTLTRVSPEGRVSVVAEIPGGPNGAAFGPDGRIYVCNNGGFSWLYKKGGMRARRHLPTSYESGSIDVVDLVSGTVHRLYSACGDDYPLSGPNDIVFDSTDGFWLTDLGKWRDRTMDRGFVYWARADGSEIREVAGPMITPNGIGLSPDGKIFYVAETDTCRLWAFEIEAPGVLRKAPWPSPNGGRVVVGMGGYRRFDSLPVTQSGAIWVAGFDGASIVEIHPEGCVLREHMVPDIMATNIAFGGADRCTAYVTLSYSGQPIAMDWHEPGLELVYNS